MKPAPFGYHEPTTLDAVLELLDALASQEGRVLAGGQSLIPSMAFRLARPAHLIDINRVAGLEQLAVEGDALAIGACVRHAAFHQPVVRGPLGPLLTEVASHIGHYPIRVRGTLCGSLAHADPASEWCLVAATLGATMVAKRAGTVRKILAEDYFKGALATALDARELLAEVRIPMLRHDIQYGFYEFSRRAGDFALAMCLVTYQLADGVIASPRVGLGGVEVHARRIVRAEAALSGRPPVVEVFERAAEEAAAEVDPAEDQHATAAYRRDLARTVVLRALERSLTC